MVQIFKIESKQIEDERIAYIGSLPKFQDLYSEILVEGSDYYAIQDHCVTVGYIIKTIDNILVEFYLIDRMIPMSSDIFLQAVKELSITKVYCKSYDYTLLNCCLIHSANYQLFGTLFMDYQKSGRYLLDNLTIKSATDSNYEFLLEQKDGLYETPEELAKYVKGGNITMFMNGDQLYGCGYLIKVHGKWDYYDIGMWVNPDFRRQGVATKIISYLKEFCLSNNWNPICACAYSNSASQKTLEKNGFISKHKLIEFEIKKAANH